MTLVLALDYGGSGIKGIASSLESIDSPQVLFIPPHLLVVPNPKHNATDYLGNPLDEIIIGYGGKSYALGCYAAHKGATPILKELKTLRSFQTLSGKYPVNLKTFRCKPEGTGVFKHYYRRRNEDQDGLVGMRTGVLMLGHRNTSFFWSKDERMSGFTSSDLGFSLVVTQTKARTMDYQDLLLAEVMANYLTTKDETALEPLLRNERETSRKKEQEKLMKVIAEEVEIYLSAIFQWISEKVNLGEIQEFVLAGGGCEPLQVPLVNYLEARLPILSGRDRPGIFLHGGMDIPATIQIPKNQNSNRFADVYGLWSEDLLPAIAAKTAHQ